MCLQRSADNFDHLPCGFVPHLLTKRKMIEISNFVHIFLLALFKKNVFLYFLEKVTMRAASSDKLARHVDLSNLLECFFGGE